MACKRRKKDKRALDLKRIRERRNHLNTDVKMSWRLSKGARQEDWMIVYEYAT